MAYFKQAAVVLAIVAGAVAGWVRTQEPGEHVGRVQTANMGGGTLFAGKPYSSPLGKLVAQHEGTGEIQSSSGNVWNFLAAATGSELLGRAMTAFNSGYIREAETRLEQELSMGSTDRHLVESLCVAGGADANYLQWIATTYVENRAKADPSSDRDTEYREIHSTIMDVLIRSQELVIAQQFNDEALRAYPNDATLVLDNARIAAAQGHDDRAIEIVTQAVDAGRKNPELYSVDEQEEFYRQLAYRLYAAGRIDEATSVAQHMRAIFPNAARDLEFMPAVST